jgi:hypothetical protein
MLEGLVSVFCLDISLLHLPAPLAVPSLLIGLSNLVASSFLPAISLNSDHGVCYGENLPGACAEY